MVVCVLTLHICISCQCTARNVDIVYDVPLDVSLDSININLSEYEKQGVYVIRDTINLQNKTLYLSADICLEMNNRIFVNGCIVGSNTGLKY